MNSFKDCKECGYKQEAGIKFFVACDTHYSEWMQKVKRIVSKWKTP